MENPFFLNLHFIIDHLQNLIFHKKIKNFHKYSICSKRENEKNIRSENFFRSGKSGGYMDELSKTQIESITECHKGSMQNHGYL